MMDQKIRLNVGGTIFQCFLSTLKAFPNSRLARVVKSTAGEDSAYDCETNEYFFDRNPLMFTFVLDAYRTGSLHLPLDLCGKTIREEMEFWEISPAAISECCWKRYYKTDNDIQAITDLTQNYLRNTNLCHLLGLRTQTLKMKIWLFLDEPSSSRYALIWIALVLIAVLVSILVSASETLDVLRQPLDEHDRQMLNRIKVIMSVSNSSVVLEKFHTRLHPSLLLLDSGCYIVISTDVILRILTCPSRIAYLKDFLHICEIVGVIDFWLVFAIDWNIDVIPANDVVVWIYLISRVFLILKVVRLFRLGRCIPTLNIMGLCIRTSLKEIYAFGAVLLILVFMFGYLVTALEFMYNDRFENAFVAMYWAAITLTTVGYGDVYPTSPMGRGLASVCAVCGMIMLALPVGVIAANFNSLYSHHRYAEKHIKTYQITSIGKQCPYRFKAKAENENSLSSTKSETK